MRSIDVNNISLLVALYTVVRKLFGSVLKFSTDNCQNNYIALLIFVLVFFCVVNTKIGASLILFSFSFLH